MTLTSKTVNNFGYVSVVIMLTLLVLVWFRLVPDSFTIPFFVIALVLFVVRLVLRIRLATLERQALQSNKRQAT